jgi:signal transduction histidine kinase
VVAAGLKYLVLAHLWLPLAGERSDLLVVDPGSSAYSRRRHQLAAGLRRPLPSGLRRPLPSGLPFMKNVSRAPGTRPAELGADRSWPFLPAWVDVAWAVFTILNLASIVVFSHWEVVPFHVIWVSLALLYGFRVWAIKPTLWVLGAVILGTFAAIGWDVRTGAQSVDELNEVPLMAAMFWVMVWHARRRLVADHERDMVSDENARLLTTQRRFLQDASHQLRTPITIALGHAELLARELADRGEKRDIEIVVGELTRLRRLGERLLVIAASEDPDFLYPEPVALDRFIMEVIRKWRPTAARRWQLGRLDAVTVSADRERLGLAVDALLENAVRHTAAGDMIQLSVVAGRHGAPARMIIADTGAGIRPSELERIFDRFRTGTMPAESGLAESGLAESGFAGSALAGSGPAGSGPAGSGPAEYGADGSRGSGSKGTGLGLALVRAVAHAHGGDVRVHSTPGAGSEFEVVLPTRQTPAGPLHLTASPGWVDPGLADEEAGTLKEDPWASRNI